MVSCLLLVWISLISLCVLLVLNCVLIRIVLWWFLISIEDIGNIVCGLGWKVCRCSCDFVVVVGVVVVGVVSSGVLVKVVVRVRGSSRVVVCMGIFCLELG